MGARTRKRIERIISAFNQYHPKDGIEAEKTCNIVLKPVAEQGAYRDTYFIEGVPLVVKFPKNNGGTHSHAKAEIKAIRRLRRGKKRYKLLQKYIPETYYENLKTGVIVMRQYKPLRSKYDILIADVLEKLVSVVWPEHVEDGTDVHGSNIALDDDGHLKIIDLGYFTEEGHDYESAESEGPTT